MERGSSLRKTPEEMTTVSFGRNTPCKDDRSHFENEFVQLTAELEAFFMAQNDAVFVCDAQMNVTRTNPAFVQICGFDPTGLNLSDVAQKLSCRSLHDKPFDDEERGPFRVCPEEKVTYPPFLINRGDGTEMAVEASSGPTRVGTRFTGCVSVWRDITDRQRAEKALHRITAQLGDRIEEMDSIIRESMKKSTAMKADLCRPSLTDREMTIITLIAQGQSSKSIARSLSISINTVTRHRANIGQKLKVNRVADIVKYAISKGLVPSSIGANV